MKIVFSDTVELNCERLPGGYSVTVPQDFIAGPCTVSLIDNEGAVLRSLTNNSAFYVQAGEYRYRTNGVIVKV